MSETAVPHMLAGNQYAAAVDFYLRRRDTASAMIIAKMSEKRVLASVERAFDSGKPGFDSGKPGFGDRDGDGDGEGEGEGFATKSARGLSVSGDGGDFNGHNSNSNNSSSSSNRRSQELEAGAKEVGVERSKLDPSRAEGEKRVDSDTDIAKPTSPASNSTANQDTFQVRTLIQNVCRHTVSHRLNGSYSTLAAAHAVSIGGNMRTYSPYSTYSPPSVWR